MDVVMRQIKINQKKSIISEEVNRLFNVYREHTGDEPMAGGAQNLLKLRQRTETIKNLFNKSQLTLLDLPVTILLEILSYLTPKELCLFGASSHYSLVLASDEPLWRKQLARLSQQWDSIFFDRNPEFFKRVCPEMASRQIFLRCIPLEKESQNTISLTLGSSASPPRIQSFNPFSYLITSITAKQRIIMFGPGLETHTSRLVRSLLTDQHLKDLVEVDRFRVVGMVPGEFAGLGSGICLSFAEHTFNLITLYSNVESVRNSQSAADRVRQNKLFQKRQGKLNSDDQFQLAPAVQELCRRSHAFIFVVDASCNSDEVSLVHSELSAMMCELWSCRQAPLLVLVCSEGRIVRQTTISPMKIVETLRLGRMGRKWLVQRGEVDSLQGVRFGVRWLLSNCENSPTTLFNSLRQ